jgi:hypothetical protein
LQLGIDPLRWSLPTALEAAFALRDSAKVDELLAIVEALPPGQLVPRVHAHGSRFAARRSALEGDAVAADTGYRAASQLYREIGAVFELALTALEHGEWLIAQERLADAEPPLAEAEEIFTRLRARPWLERVEQARARTLATA